MLVCHTHTSITPMMKLKIGSMYFQYANLTHEKTKIFIYQSKYTWMRRLSGSYCVSVFMIWILKWCKNSRFDWFSNVATFLSLTTYNKWKKSCISKRKAKLLLGEFIHHHSFFFFSSFCFYFSYFSIFSKLENSIYFVQSTDDGCYISFDEYFHSRYLMSPNNYLIFKLVCQMR